MPIHQRDMYIYAHKKTCTRMFVATLLIAPNANIPRISLKKGRKMCGYWKMHTGREFHKRCTVGQSNSLFLNTASQFLWGKQFYTLS